MRRERARTQDRDGLREVACSLATEALSATEGPRADLEAIARALGVHEIRSADMSSSGELRRHGNGYMIILAADQGAARARFSLAHEIGHVLMRRARIRIERNTREWLCDRIAAELLMPAGSFRVAAGPRPDLLRISRLASRFGTSLAATAKRCGELTSSAAFEVEDGQVMWREGIDPPTIRVLLRLVPPADRVKRLYETSFEAARPPSFRVQVAGLGDRRSLWVLVPRTAAERTSQTHLFGPETRMSLP